MIDIEELRACIEEYSDTFDETATTRFPYEAFLKWVAAQQHAATLAQEQPNEPPA